MRILLTLLLTIFITTEIVSSKTKCTDFTCEDNSKRNKIKCMEIVEPSGLVRYFMMYNCAAQEFKCNLGDEVNIKYVGTSACYNHFNTRSPLSNSVESARRYKLPKQCPKRCPAPNKSACARFGKGLYRSFRSSCYLHMYKCEFPRDRIKMVSWRYCNKSQPILGLQETEESESNHVDSRDDHPQSNPQPEYHKKIRVPSKKKL